MLYDELPIPVSERKSRLLAAAFCRRVWHLLTDERGRQAVAVAERYADGQATPAELRSACAAAEEITDFDGDTVTWCEVAGTAFVTAEPSPSPLDAAYIAAENVGWRAARAADEDSDEPDAAAKATERAAQCELVREVLGNPFRPAAFDPGWRTTTVVLLAREMYESRDFSAMPILADALQDAGCEDEQLLGHCRRPGPHVRGCWALDLVLGKG